MASAGVTSAVAAAMHLVDYTDPAAIKQVPTRNGFGEGLVEAGRRDERIVAICADLSESTRMEAFKKTFPQRYIEIGVSEQLLVAMAAGLASAGKIPFIASYAMFNPGRSWEQVRTTMALNETNVKIAGAHAGVSVGPDGATHQAIEDIAIMRVIPKMTVVVPCDSVQTKKGDAGRRCALRPDLPALRAGRVGRRHHRRDALRDRQGANVSGRRRRRDRRVRHPALQRAHRSRSAGQGRHRVHGREQPHHQTDGRSGDPRGRP